MRMAHGDMRPIDTTRHARTTIGYVIETSRVFRGVRHLTFRAFALTVTFANMRAALSRRLAHLHITPVYYVASANGFSHSDRMRRFLELCEQVHVVRNAKFWSTETGFTWARF